MDLTPNNKNSSSEYSCKQRTPTGAPDVTVTKNVGRRVQKKESDGLQERRVSPRLKNIPKEKKPYYGSNLRPQLETSEDDGCCSEALYINKKRKSCDSVSNAGKEKTNIDLPRGEFLPNAVGQNTEDFLVTVEDDDMDILDLEDGPLLKWTSIEHFLATCKGQKDNAGEEKRSKKVEESDLQIDEAEDHIPERKDSLYSAKKICCQPDICIEHEFSSRAAIVEQFFHGYWSSGIDYVQKISGKLNKGNGFTCPIAIAILLSRKCGDDDDNSTEVVYTAQSGNNFFGNEQQKYQVMHNSILALKNNTDLHIPVRVFCRYKGSERDSGTIYKYCGLYKVSMKHKAEKTVHGLKFSKCHLKRLLGQRKVNIEREKLSEIHSGKVGLVYEDISFGEEAVRIPVTNTIDDPPIAPKVFQYTKDLHFAKNVILPPTASGCKCKGNCTDPRTCSCAQLNGSDFPYVRKDGGRLIEPKDVVYECGPNCSCGPNCINRTSQRGLKYRLEIYRTINKGWAVKTLDFIPSGAPVCEYIGTLRRSDELDNEAENEYIFDIDCLLTINGIGSRERRQGLLPPPDMEIDEQMAGGDSEFCIDAGSSGNISRFINHSCEPNLFVQSVLSSHRDMRLARIMLFAADDIQPLDELTYDYGYELDSVYGPDGKVKRMKCCCGTNECRGRLF